MAKALSVKKSFLEYSSDMIKESQEIFGMNILKLKYIKHSIKYNYNNANFVLIDGSYYIFYRFFALLNWWKLARKDEPIDNPGENEEFKKNLNLH